MGWNERRRRVAKDKDWAASIERVQRLESRIPAESVVEHPKHFRDAPAVVVDHRIDKLLKAFFAQLPSEKFSSCRVTSAEVRGYSGF
jgi:hypothetical protein